MKYDLPPFEQLVALGKQDPGALEQLRIELCEALIHDAPDTTRRKLRGLQFRIDMQRRKARSPMAACIAISGMMHDEFDQLRQALHDAAGQPMPMDLFTGQVANSSESAQGGPPAKVIPFRRA